jgi:hypothetical protein
LRQGTLISTGTPSSTAAAINGLNPLPSAPELVDDKEIGAGREFGAHRLHGAEQGINVELAAARHWSSILRNCGAAALGEVLQEHIAACAVGAGRVDLDEPAAAAPATLQARDDPQDE